VGLYRKARPTFVIYHRLLLQLTVADELTRGLTPVNLTEVSHKEPLYEHSKKPAANLTFFLVCKTQ